MLRSVRTHFVERIPELLCASPQHRKDLLVVIRRQDDGASMDDSSLFRGDLPDRVAEVFGVVERDRRDEGGDRPYYIGGVEPAAHAHFEHGNLATFPMENDERQKRQRFEVSRVD